MATLRQQFMRQATLSVAANPSVTVVDLLGPESPLQPPYAENTDHVVLPRQDRQNEAGFVVIDGWAAPFNVATVNVDVEIWERASNASQRGLDSALFPSGAAAPADPQLKRVVATGLLGDDTAAIDSILGGGLGGRDTKDVPLLHVRANEFVRLRVNNTGAGALGPITLTAKYDLGGHPGDTNRL